MFVVLKIWSKNTKYKWNQSCSLKQVVAFCDIIVNFYAILDNLHVDMRIIVGFELIS